MFVTQCIITDFSASALYKQTNKYKNLGCRRVTSRAMQRKNEEKKNNLPEQKLSHCFRRGTSPSWIRICLYVMYRLRHILGLSQEPLLALNRLENQQNAKLYKHTKPSEKKKMAWKTKIFLLIFPCIIAKMMMMMSIIMMIIIIMQRYSFSCHSTFVYSRIARLWCATITSPPKSICCIDRCAAISHIPTYCPTCNPIPHHKFTKYFWCCFNVARALSFFSLILVAGRYTKWL